MLDTGNGTTSKYLVGNPGLSNVLTPIKNWHDSVSKDDKGICTGSTYATEPVCCQIGEDGLFSWHRTFSLGNGGGWSDAEWGNSWTNSWQGNKPDRIPKTVSAFCRGSACCF